MKRLRALNILGKCPREKGIVGRREDLAFGAACIVGLSEAIHTYRYCNPVIKSPIVLQPRPLAKVAQASPWGGR